MSICSTGVVCSGREGKIDVRSYEEIHAVLNVCGVSDCMCHTEANRKLQIFRGMWDRA